MAKYADFYKSVSQASDEVMEIYCDPCYKRKQLFVFADGFCVDCSEYLCGQCYDSHLSFKAMEFHVFHGLDSMSVADNTDEGIIDECVTKCSNHPSKVIEFFCGTCETLGCYACFTVNHRQCPKVEHIPDIVKKPEAIVEFTEFDEKLNDLAKILHREQEQLASYTEINTEMKNLAKNELNKQRTVINKFFDDLENLMDTKIEIIKKGNNRTLKIASKKLNAMAKEFIELKTCTKLKKYGQKCELFIAIKKNMEKMEALNELFHKLPDVRKIQTYTVLPSEQIEAMMRNVTEICRLTTARFQTKIDISTGKDKLAPHITGLTTVQGHYCVVSDIANKSVKVVDTREQRVTSEIGIEARVIRGLTSVKGDQVAVSVVFPVFSSEAFQIQFFSVSSSGLIESIPMKLKLDTVCSDLGYCNGKLFLGQGAGLLICNITGQAIKKIKYDSAGVSIFRGLNLGISLSPDGKTIYATDPGNNSIISMTLDGSVEAIFTNKDLAGPYGITVDNHGYVYVSSRNCTERYRIHQLTPDLSSGQIIIEDVGGEVITFSGTENKLFVSEGNWVSVYDIKKH